MTTSSVIDPHKIIAKLESDILRRAGGSLELSQRAAITFGQLNGWRTGPNVRSFKLEYIGRASSRASLALLEGGLIDHPIYYACDGRCAALVCQPYAHSSYGLMAAEAKRLARQHELALHIPPHPLASLWFPNRTAFFVFTARDHKIIQWLPEQIDGFGEQQRVVKLACSPSIVPAISCDTGRYAVTLNATSISVGAPVIGSPAMGVRS
jgi:hypothetical protein